MGNFLRNYLYTLVVILCSDLSEGYKILVVFPLDFTSHRILGNSCVQLLLEAGHQVTYVTWVSEFIEPHKNLTVIDVSIPMLKERKLNLERYVTGKMDVNLHGFTMKTSVLMRKCLEHENIQKFLSDPKENFDLAILEWIYTEYIVGFPAVLDCPFIWISTVDAHPLILDLIGEMANPAHTPLVTFRSIPPFTFLERVLSLKDLISIYLYREYYVRRIEENEYERVIAPLAAKRRGVVPSYDELRYNASLVLGNSHVSVGRLVQLPAAYKPVGGYHVNAKRNPLPKDLKLLMDNSTNGLIYFSMGSSLLSTDFSADVTKSLLKVFGGLKQTVLWKYEGDLPDKPNNVHLVSWAPQQSILGHKNCVLFISHSGQLSILEAVHYGVPVIGIPVFADQYSNIRALVMNGMAKQVNPNVNIAEDFKAAILDVLGNSSYAEAAKYQSFIYHNRPVSPAVEMVHWVEHVILTNGAAHLRSVALRVPWYQRYYLDLAIVVFALLLLLFLTVKQLLFMKYQPKRHAEKKVQ